MDYYEELGLRRDATAAEIHEAYKLAARLLHPDLQRDRRLKELAECQMRRLSGVVETLVKPEERARYDAALIHQIQPGHFPLVAESRGSQLRQAAAQYWFWILLGSMTMGMGTWYGLAGSAESNGSVGAEIAGVPREAIPLGKSVPFRNQSMRFQEPAGPQQVSRQPAPRFPVAEVPEPVWIAAIPPPSPNAYPEPTGVPLVATPLIPEIGSPEPAGNECESGFRGRWLFAAEAGEGGRAGTYPARYVEFVLHEENGRLAGEYRAVYGRLDKAITPEVVFHVLGEVPEGNAGSLQWESKAGAKGELDLTLEAPNRLLVKWWTTHFGKQEVLSSGMAALTRLKTE